MTSEETSKYTREQIFAKIEKLMNLANHEATNEHLAAASAAKAQELMQNWAITETELAAASGQADAPKYIMEQVPFLLSKVWIWERWLGVRVSKAFFTHQVTDEKKGVITWCGREADVKMTAYIFVQLRTTLDKLAREAFQRHAADYKDTYGTSVYKKSNAQAYRGKWLTSWMDGAVAEVGKRLEAQTQKFSESGSTAMMIVETRPLEAKAHAITVYGNLVQSRKSKRTVFTEASNQGRIAGKTVPINKGLTVADPPKNLS